MTVYEKIYENCRSDKGTVMSKSAAYDLIEISKLAPALRSWDSGLEVHLQAHVSSISYSITWCKKATTSHYLLTENDVFNPSHKYISSESPHFTFQGLANSCYQCTLSNLKLLPVTFATTSSQPSGPCSPQPTKPSAAPSPSLSSTCCTSVRSTTSSHKPSPTAGVGSWKITVIGWTARASRVGADGVSPTTWGCSGT